MFPVRGHEPTGSGNLAQPEHCRVRWKNGQRAAFRNELEATIEGLCQISDHLDALGWQTAVLEAKRELLGPLTGGHQAPQTHCQRLEIDVPDPRDVAAVGDLVVQRDDRDVR